MKMKKKIIIHEVFFFSFFIFFSCSTKKINEQDSYSREKRHIN